MESKTSTFKPLPIVYGSCRIVGALIWDGKYTKQQQSNDGGKGSSNDSGDVS